MFSLPPQLPSGFAQLLYRDHVTEHIAVYSVNVIPLWRVRTQSLDCLSTAFYILM